MASKSFKDTFELLKSAREKAVEAAGQTDSELADAYYRSAYYMLYKACSLGHSIFAACAQNGVDMRGGVFSWASRDFDDLSRMLLTRFYREGNYPKGDDALEQFEVWLARVRNYLNSLANESALLKSTRPHFDSTAWKMENRNGWDSRSMMLE